MHTSAINRTLLCSNVYLDYVALCICIRLSRATNIMTDSCVLVFAKCSSLSQVTYHRLKL
jgi:hypothetical protein